MIAIKWMGMTVLAFLVGYAVMIGVDPANFPIKTVSFRGERQGLSWDALQEATEPFLGSGLIRLPVADLQEVLSALPWMKQVDIRKAWPGKVVIRFEEHVPAARWEGEGIVSAEGVYFVPEGKLTHFDHLPQLGGPSSKRAIVWKNYVRMEAILRSDELSIAELRLAPRGAWVVKLNNGIMLHLGRDEVLNRVQQFVRMYKTSIESKQNAVAYVDLRYTRGMAVGWKS